MNAKKHISVKVYYWALIPFIIGFLCPAQAQIIITIAGNGTAGFSGDGTPAVSAQINYAKGIAINETGIYFSDQVNFRIRYINPSGIISTFAGIGMPGNTGDGGPASLAKINGTKGIALDAMGNLYIADQQNNKARKIDNTGIISTFAGNGIVGFSGEDIPATSAELAGPFDIALDNAGSIYISDAANHRIRKVNSSGTITTYAGGGPSGLGDGGLATAAQLGTTYGIAIDAVGNLYIADPDNKRIRKVDAAGIITTFAGNGVVGYSGDGGLATIAELNNPSGLAVDGSGNLFIADQGNNCIRKVDAAGIITTVAGNGIPGYSGDGLAATVAQLNTPEFITLDCAGDIYINDNLNNRIRVVIYDHLPVFANGRSQELAVCTNSMPVSINALMTVIDSDISQTEKWSLTAPPMHGTASATYGTTSTGGAIIPVGLSYTPESGYSGNDSFKMRVSDCAFFSDSTTVYVTVTPPPQAGAITGSSSLCPGHTIHLADTTAGGAWHSSNGHAAVSAGTATGVTTGMDTIIYVVANMCGADTAIFPVTVLPLPCDEGVAAAAGQGEELIVFPNPNDGTFTFTLPSAANEEVRITVTNTVGQKVGAITTTTNKATTIKLNVPPGVYFLNASAGSRVYNAKVVVAR